MAAVTSEMKLDMDLGEFPCHKLDEARVHAACEARLVPSVAGALTPPPEADLT